MEIKTKPIDAFHGDLDCRPIYLGHCKRESSYWFYTLKDKVPRFLKYISYFHWDRGPQEVLEMKPLPEEVELELQQFLEGKFGYEFRKRRKNSKDTTAFKVYRIPDDLSGNCDSETKRSKRILPVCQSGDADPGRPLPGPSAAERKDETTGLHGSRKPRRSRHAVSAEYSSSGTVPSPASPVIEVPLLPSTPVTLEPKRRGRPPKIQVVEESSPTVSSDVVEPVSSEQPNVEAKRKPRKPKSKPENGLVLGSVELLKAFEVLLPVEPEVTIRKKRGRPFKVKP